MVEEGREARRAVEKAGTLPPGKVYELLSAYPREVVVYAWARTVRRAAAAAIGTYLKESVHVATRLRGRDLRELGYPPGPAYRSMLSALLRKRIDGGLSTRDEEVRWILETFPPPDFRISR